MIRLGILVAITAASISTNAASAATFDPTDFDAIFTESRRASTLGRLAMGGSAIVRSGDIGTLNIGALHAETDALVAGKIKKRNRDTYTSSDVTGALTVQVETKSKRYKSAKRSKTRTLYELIVDGVVVDSVLLRTGKKRNKKSFSFAPITVDGAEVSLRITGKRGKSISYDAAFYVSDGSTGAFSSSTTTLGAVDPAAAAAAGGAAAGAVSAVPLPAGMPLLIGAGAALGLVRRRRKS